MYLLVLDLLLPLMVMASVVSATTIFQARPFFFFRYFSTLLTLTSNAKSSAKSVLVASSTSSLVNKNYVLRHEFLLFPWHLLLTCSLRIPNASKQPILLFHFF